MSTDTLKRAALFLVLVLAQVLVLGRIKLFGYATPLLYVYFVVMLPRNYPKWAALLWGFALGLIVDTFTNTPGVAAAAMTLTAVLQPYYFQCFIPKDAYDELQPSLSTIGPMKYTSYVVPLVLLYCLMFYTLEMFTFSNPLQWLLTVVGSSVVTLLLIFTFEVAKSKS